MDKGYLRNILYPGDSKGLSRFCQPMLSFFDDNRFSRYICYNQAVKPMENILNFLKQLDLSEIEAKLYLNLLKNGPMSVRDLAETVEIKRTTAYFYIDQLVEKGLVMKMVQGSKKLVCANPPESLQHLVDEKISSAKIMKESFPNILKTLKTALPINAETHEAEIQYFKGKNGVKKIYDDALNGSELRLYVNLAELERVLIVKTLNMDYDIFNQALRKNSKLKIYEIIVNAPDSVRQFKLEETAKEDRYRYKFTSKDIRLASPAILLYDDKVAIINSHGNINSIVLHNTDYYNNSKDLFDFMWKMLP
jgi:sugar-specific transcriptional regulator TrmB